MPKYICRAVVFVPDPSTIAGDTEEEPAGLRLEFLGIMETLIKTVRIEQYAEADLLTVMLFADVRLVVEQKSIWFGKKARQLAQAA